jgi:hypothetical protein
MNLAEVALRREKERLTELLKEQQQQDALQVLKQGWESVQPYLRKAYLGQLFGAMMGPMILPGLLKNYSPKYLANYIVELQIFEPPASPEEAKIQLLADLVIFLTFPEIGLNYIIYMAQAEIEKVYKVVMKEGGGWSAYKSTPDKRKGAVLEWHRRNEARLTYLKEAHLQDEVLYEDRSGQEKREFRTSLLIKIVKDVTNKELTFRNVYDRRKKLKKLEQPLRLEDLKSLT